MGKLRALDVQFSNHDGMLYAGNILNGHVVVELNEPLKMRGVTITLEGYARVSWEEGSGSTKEEYYAREVYFNQTVPLFGSLSTQGNNTTELGTGRHVFPFNFQLPRNSPASFEGGVGYVRYTAKGTIDRPWKFNYNTTKPFFVVAVLDLNQFHMSTKGSEGTNEKNLCCCCCKSDPIHASFKIERSGYVPGEAIRLSAEIINRSNRKMNKSFVTLRMVKTFHARGKTKTVYTDMARVERPAIEAHRDDIWSWEQLVVPALPPSFLTGCSIIDINYTVQLNVNPSGPSLMLTVPLGIIIGTVPLQSVVEQFPALPTSFGGANIWTSEYGSSSI